MSNKKTLGRHILALEPRMMFDGAGVVTAVATDIAPLADLPGEYTFQETSIAPVALDGRPDLAWVAGVNFGSRYSTELTSHFTEIPPEAIYADDEDFGDVSPNGSIGGQHD